MNPSLLILFTRKGCCLCEGLEQRLSKLPFEKLSPPLELRVIDIDESDASELEKTLYNLKVPVLLFRSLDFKSCFELPRVSPRLDEENLLRWLQKMINIAFNS